MKNELLFLLIYWLIAVNSYGQEGCFDEPIVKQNRLVYDKTEMLSLSEVEQLETKLTNYSDTTSTQIAIVIVEHVHCGIGFATIELGDEWGIGEASQDNGILFLVASEDRKIFIATGEAAQIQVPDVLAGRIIDNVIKPNFRNGYFFTGLDKATTMVMELMSGEYETIKEAEPEGIPLWVIVLAVFVILFLISRINRRGGKQIDYNRNGRWIFDGDWGQNDGSWGDFKQGRGVFIPPTGGGWGRSSGGSGGGGGFGGFGGGSFGGGGAGGSW